MCSSGVTFCHERITNCIEFNVSLTKVIPSEFLSTSTLPSLPQGNVSLSPGLRRNGSIMMQSWRASLATLSALFMLSNVSLGLAAGITKHSEVVMDQIIPVGRNVDREKQPDAH